MNLEMFTEIAGGLDHPEGVARGPDGSLYAGGEAGQVYRIGDGDVVEVGTTGGFLFGIALDAAGNVFACDFGAGSLARVTPSGEVSTVSSGTERRPMQVPNFAAFAEDGSLFVTDSGTWGADEGVVFRIRPGGTTEVWSDAVPAFPNGCCMTAEGDALLVVESRARRVALLRLNDDGTASEPETVVELHGSQPDGVALAADGTMLVGCYRPDRIWRVDPDGRAEVLAEDPDGVVLNQPANVAFVGPDLDRIVVSSLGGWSLMGADVGLTGVPLRYPDLS